MAKIVNVVVSRNSWGSTINVFLDSNIDPKERRYEERDNTYLSILGGIASFFYYDRPGSGFGGMHIPVTMTDGTERVLIGPWSSNSSAVNERFPETKVVEATIHTPDGGCCGGAVSVDSLVAKCKELGTDIEFGWVRLKGCESITYLKPLLNGELYEKDANSYELIAAVV